MYCVVRKPTTYLPDTNYLLPLSGYLTLFYRQSAVVANVDIDTRLVMFNQLAYNTVSVPIFGSDVDVFRTLRCEKVKKQTSVDYFSLLGYLIN